MTITYEQVRSNAKIRTYIRKQDDNLIALGYTEHSFNHVCRVAHTAAGILSTLEYPPHEVELVQIAGYLHDIGNVINRIDHAQSGAMMAFRLLEEMGVDPEDVSLIISAVGNHDEGTGYPVNELAAALILADKSDVRRSRVRTRDVAFFDIHDRVNYAVESASCEITQDKKNFQLKIQIDTQMSAVMDYFEIFLQRMLFCRKAAEKLGLKFQLVINEQILL